MRAYLHSQYVDLQAAAHAIAAGDDDGPITAAMRWGLSGETPKQTLIGLILMGGSPFLARGGRETKDGRQGRRGIDDGRCFAWERVTGPRRAREAD